MRVRRRIVVPLLVASGVGVGIAGLAVVLSDGPEREDDRRALKQVKVTEAVGKPGCADLVAVAEDADRMTVRSFEISLIPDSGAITVYGDDGTTYDFGLSDSDCIEGNADVAGLVAGAITHHNGGLRTLCPSTLKDLGAGTAEIRALRKRIPVPVGRGQDERFLAPLGELTAEASSAVDALLVGPESLPSGSLRAPTVEWVKEACFGVSPH